MSHDSYRYLNQELAEYLHVQVLTVAPHAVINFSLFAFRFSASKAKQNKTKKSGHPSNLNLGVCLSVLLGCVFRKYVRVMNLVWH
jgi:hypothetical protein